MRKSQVKSKKFDFNYSSHPKNGTYYKKICLKMRTADFDTSRCLIVS